MKVDSFIYKVIVNTQYNVDDSISDDQLSQILVTKSEIVNWLLERHCIPGIDWQFSNRKFKVSKEGYITHCYEFRDAKMAALFKLTWAS